MEEVKTLNSIEEGKGELAACTHDSICVVAEPHNTDHGGASSAVARTDLTCRAPNLALSMQHFAQQRIIGLENEDRRHKRTGRLDRVLNLFLARVQSAFSA
jgi:hypothetical protein